MDGFVLATTVGAGTFGVKLDIGLIGELLVELKLAELGWHPIRLDSRRAAANADLIALRGAERTVIQVKTSHAQTGGSHPYSLHLGRAGAFLRTGSSFFNSKDGPMAADLIVGVYYRPSATRFFVLPVSVAETLCQRHALYWNSVTKRTGGQRDASFPVYIPFDNPSRAHAQHFGALAKTLGSFEERWDLLSLS